MCVVKKEHAASEEERGKGGGDSHQVWVTAALASGVSSSIRGESDRNGMSMPPSFLGARHHIVSHDCVSHRRSGCDSTHAEGTGPRPNALRL